MAGGQTWARCGVRREHDPLRCVLLSRPGAEFDGIDRPDEALFVEAVDLARLRLEAKGIADFYASRGIGVHVYEPPSKPPPNLVFLRDLFFMTPQGAVLARMASQQRAGEERFAAHALAAIGVPILHTVRGDATFEGADALWLDEKTVLVGVGFRTNRAGLAQLSGVLAEMGAAAVPIDIPRDVQHLLGAVNLVDADLAVARADRIVPALREELRRRGVRILELPPDDEVLVRRSLNFVALGPRRVVLPAGCPRTREALEAAGIACDEVEAGEYARAAGGLGCLTGVIWRG